MHEVRYSPVAPLPILKGLHKASLLGNYLLVIAPEILKDPDGYERLCRGAMQRDAKTVIVDNGVIERGHSISATGLLQAATTVDASCIVLPDVLRDRIFTTQRVVEFLRKYEEALGHGFMPRLLMAVPQGETLLEITTCVDWLDVSLVSHKRCWGVPRWMAEDLGTRKGVIEYIREVCPKEKIHLLGMSKNFKDDIACTKLPNVVGIDSANPIVLGYHGHEIGRTNYLTEHMVRPEDFWDWKELNEEMMWNVHYIRDAIGEYRHPITAGSPVPPPL